MSSSARIAALLMDRQREAAGFSRREFMKFCGLVAVALGMEASMGPVVARALEGKRRPSVIYMHGAECTGCTEALLRAVDPYVDVLIMEIISLDYCETIMAAAGDASHKALETAMRNPDGYICTIEGAIPTRDGGLYGQVGGETMLSLFSRVAAGAKAVIAMGSCASFGGIQAAAPNPSGAKGVGEALAAVGVAPINIAGCPPNPVNYIGTVVHLLTKGMPELDSARRPRMFFGRTVHDLCERRKHFDKGEFAPSFSSEEARAGWCLHKLGCRGPWTYNNCPTALFNQTNWPVRAGGPCIGCSEPGFWDQLAPFSTDIREKKRA
ncbi:hydrogenase small subunit [Desulfocurvus sp.]|jgi:ferredoxin hydrogenase small subunit/hydrogenase small subunit|uniref:hydrogenase small subunit n=1 Tax=Desulfocurvus sp. TaxID=2871698 RepID=UPI0025C73B9F|nr:hydrogenase small subunit [Desulfocurvus sp.]MCK9240061.1 hydrogenase small subunit [Desulfocurvus sp.]